MLNRDWRRSKRKVKASNLSRSNKVGILFTPKDEATFKKVRNLQRKLKEEGIREVHLLGYVDLKEIPAYLPPKGDIEYFTKKELNWFFRPTASTARSFINKEFEILLDLTMEDNLPLQFVLAFSKARMKAGQRSALRSRFLDLSLETKKDDSLDHLIGQLRHYLNMINKSELHAEKI